MLTSREKSYAAAQKFQQKGQLDKAIAELERLVQEDAADVRTLLKIGDLHVRRQDTPAAIGTYTQVAHIYRDQGFFLKAVAVYKQVVHLAPDNATAVGELAALYEQLSLVSDAAVQLRHLLGLHKAAKRWADAATVLRKLLTLEGETQDLLLQWAEVHTELHDLPEVKRTLTRVADACLAQGRTDDWAQVAEDLLQADPDLGGLACELAKYYMGKELPKQALLKLQVAFRAAPQDTETLTLLAEVFEALGQAQKAIAVLHELGIQAQQRSQALALERIAGHILKLDPEDRQAQAWLAPPGAAKAAAAKQQLRPPPPPVAEASGAALPAAPKDGGKVDLTNLLIEASVFARYGLMTRAQEYLARVLAAFPDHAEALALQAQLAGQLQDPKLPSPPAEAPPATDVGTNEPEPKASEPDAAAHFAFDAPLPPHQSPTGPKTDSSRPLPGDGPEEPEFLLDLDEPQGDSGTVNLDELIAEEVPDESSAPRSATRLDKHFDTILMHADGGEPIAPLTQVVEPTDYDTQYNLGIAYKEMGLFADALTQFGKLVDIDAYKVSARSMSALCHEGLGQHDQAQEILRAALALPEGTSQERVALHYELAVSLLASGDEAGARQHFQEAADAQPDFRDVTARLAHPHLAAQS